MPWIRPGNVPVGQVWSRFKGKDRDGVPGRMYQIRDMEPKHRNMCIDLMLEHFLRDEPLCKVLDINSDLEGIATIKSNWESYVSQNMSIACFTEKDGQPDELVGFNILIVKTVNDEEESLDNVKGEQWKKLLKTLIAAEELVNIFKHYDLDSYLTSSGLVVLPSHRGQNIGARIFEARESLGKAFNIKATATVFTAKTSQVLAMKCGYELLAELDYSEMMKQGVDLSACEASTAQLRGKKFNF